MVLLFYAYDLVSRVSPEMEKCRFLSPFSYANASDILSTGEIAAGSGGAAVGAGNCPREICAKGFVLAEI